MYLFTIFDLCRWLWARLEGGLLEAGLWEQDSEEVWAAEGFLFGYRFGWGVSKHTKSANVFTLKHSFLLGSMPTSCTRSSSVWIRGRMLSQATRWLATSCHRISMAIARAFSAPSLRMRRSSWAGFMVPSPPMGRASRMLVRRVRLGTTSRTSWRPWLRCCRVVECLHSEAYSTATIRWERSHSPLQ